MSARAKVKQGLKSVLYLLGVFGLLHRWRNRHVLTVLMFHRVLPAGSLAYQLAEKEFTFSTTGFERCLEFVRRHYTVVTLHDVQAAAKNGTDLPRNPVLITFDDGWRDTVLHAEPLLRKHKMKATLFLSTEVLDLESCRWWQDAMVAVMADKAGQQRLQAAISRISASVLPDDPTDAGRALTAHLASLLPEQRLELLELAQPGVFDAILERQMLTLDDLYRLEGGAIELGGHGHTHAPLTQAADAQAELKISMERLRSLRTGPLSMSFPHGAMNESLVNQAHEVGFELVFTSEPTLSLVSNAVDATLGRIHVPENRWTCRDGQVDAAQLATFLFFRPRAPVVTNGAPA
ncbi:MAG: polysaccharide deacetylase [Burkholderiales bacterium]|nr:MAG: polysaccharide deacetylase [Burkholderiales bacterium]